MAPTPEPPLIVIVGPTASGKTALAIELASEFNGEIICADSRTIYKRMDIGTAKPTAEERAIVPHHLLDIVEPNQKFSAAEFKRLAIRLIEDIRSRGKVPFLVGGSGLYIDSVIFDYQFGEPGNPELHKKLEGMSIGELIEYCISNNIELPENSKNKRYLVRAIEQKGVNYQRRDGITKNTLVVGISTYKEELRRRITARADQLFASGMLSEALSIGKEYGWAYESMTGNIYRFAAQVARGEMSAKEAESRSITADWRLAKRQLTWFRRNPFIQWGSAKEVASLVRGYLN